MDYTPFVKKLVLPPSFAAPVLLEHDGLVATPLTRADLEQDLAAVNASIEVIRATRGGWPDAPVERADDLLDLAWHEREFREATSFAYALRDDAGAYVGCCYLYPMGLRTPLLSRDLLNYDVDVSWWVAAEAFDRGLYARAHAALQAWLAAAFPFRAVWWSNARMP